jgi:hypothetical protein
VRLSDNFTCVPRFLSSYSSPLLPVSQINRACRPWPVPIILCVAGLLVLLLLVPVTLQRRSSSRLVPELLLSAPLCRFYVSAEKSVFLLRTVSCLTQVFLTKSDFGSTLLHLLKICTDIIMLTNKISPLKPELNSSTQRCLTRFLLGVFLLEPCISLIYARKTNKRNNYLFS